MNWRSGLLRTWIVFSVLWIGVGLFFTDANYWNARIEAAKATFELSEVEMNSAWIEREKLAVSQTPVTEKWIFSRKYPGFLQAKSAAETAVFEYRILKLFVLLPPTILFALGCGFLWIRSGFMGRSNC